MYEVKERKKLDINWKSLGIKMAILLCALFIFLWIASLVKKDDKMIASNIDTNLLMMKDAALEYFTGSRLPNELNGKNTITLGEMFDTKLLVEFKDQDNKSCDLEESYAEVTKINDEEYTIKVKLVCSRDTDYVVTTVKYENSGVADDDVLDDEQNQDEDNIDEDLDPDESEENEEDISNDNSNNNSNVTKPSTSTKPNSSTNVSKPSTNASTNVTITVPNVSVPDVVVPEVVVPEVPKVEEEIEEETPVVICPYGNKEYYSRQPLAHIVDGECALAKDEYDMKYSNILTVMGANEYTKLSREMSNISGLMVEAPVYLPIYNKSYTGIVGYQIVFKVKKKETYTTRTVYEYYLNQNGERVEIVNNLASLY